MSPVPSSRYVAVVPTLAPQIEAAVQANEKERRLSASVVKAMVDAGLFRLWIPRVFGGEEAQPADLAQVVEAVSRIDGATGWCLMIGGCYGAFAGYMKEEGASHIFGRDLSVVTGGAFRPSGTAVLVDGGYRVTGRWALGSGCHHCSWLVGGCQIFDGGAPLKTPEGMPKTRIMFFPAASAEIIDTWDSIGLRGTGSHDYAVKDVFVPHNYSVSNRAARPRWQLGWRDAVVRRHERNPELHGSLLRSHQTAGSFVSLKRASEMTTAQVPRLVSSITSHLVKTFLQIAPPNAHRMQGSDECCSAIHPRQPGPKWGQRRSWQRRVWHVSYTPTYLTLLPRQGGSPVCASPESCAATRLWDGEPERRPKIAMRRCLLPPNHWTLTLEKCNGCC